MNERIVGVVAVLAATTAMVGFVAPKPRAADAYRSGGAYVAFALPTSKE